jgi:hypothetical protein
LSGIGTHEDAGFTGIMGLRLFDGSLRRRKARPVAEKWRRWPGQVRYLLDAAVDLQGVLELQDSSNTLHLSLFVRHAGIDILGRLICGEAMEEVLR